MCTNNILQSRRIVNRTMNRIWERSFIVSGINIHSIRVPWYGFIPIRMKHLSDHINAANAHNSRRTHFRFRTFLARQKSSKINQIMSQKWRKQTSKCDYICFSGTTWRRNNNLQWKPKEKRLNDESFPSRIHIACLPTCLPACLHTIQI